jgi:hypothetical protein
MSVPLVILLEINATSFAILEFEGDAPGSIDVNRIPLRIEPMQGMKIEAGNIHFLGADGDVETIEPCENAPMHLRIDLRAPALGPKLRKGLASERSNTHAGQA